MCLALANRRQSQDVYNSSPWHCFKVGHSNCTVAMKKYLLRWTHSTFFYSLNFQFWRHSIYTFIFFFSCSFVSFENLQSAGIRSIHRKEYILQSSNKTCGTFMERQGRGNVLFIFFEQYYSIQPRAVVQSCATENIMSLCICKCCHSYFLLLCWVCLWNRGAFFIPFFFSRIFFMRTLVEVGFEWKEIFYSAIFHFKRTDVSECYHCPPATCCGTQSKTRYKKKEFFLRKTMPECHFNIRLCHNQCDAVQNQLHSFFPECKQIRMICHVWEVIKLGSSFVVGNMKPINTSQQLQTNWCSNTHSAQVWAHIQYKSEHCTFHCCICTTRTRGHWERVKQKTANFRPHMCREYTTGHWLSSWVFSVQTAYKLFVECSCSCIYMWHSSDAHIIHFVCEEITVLGSNGKLAHRMWAGEVLYRYF